MRKPLETSVCEMATFMSQKATAELGYRTAPHSLGTLGISHEGTRSGTFTQLIVFILYVNETKMTTKKISPSGQYLSFPGFTVVADVFQKNAGLFRRIHARMQACPLITDYNALLPAESYHITAFSLNEQRRMNDREFEDWIRSQSRAMQFTHRELEAQTKPFTFRITGVRHQKLTFMCEVDPAAESVQRTVAEMTPYAENIPGGFHISLGYEFKKVKDKTYFDRVHELMMTILNEELPNFQSVDLHAHQPKLCYFHDMTRFIPFDGSRNPFKEAEASTSMGEAEDESDELRAESKPIAEGDDLFAFC